MSSLSYKNIPTSVSVL